jgi:hypothetical protein
VELRAIHLVLVVLERNTSVATVRLNSKLSTNFSTYFSRN